jgi:hypothetical protein
MVSAHFERLFASHNKTNLLRLLVLQQSRITRPALFPFVPFRAEPEELCTPRQGKKEKGCQRGVRKMNVTRIGREGNIQLEDYSLVLFISLCYNLLCELDDGFKVRVMLFIRLSQTSSMVNCMTNTWCGAESRGVKVPTFGANGFRESAMMYDGGG